MRDVPSILGSGHFRKGLVLAGGSGSRLSPLTRAVSKQLLPVFDKPMVYYPLSVLMLTGIRHILLITRPVDLPAFQRLLGDGSQLGMRFEYAVQPEPHGLAEAFVIGRDFIAGDHVALVLGDNIFHGQGLQRMLSVAADRTVGATVFIYAVRDPRQYGVLSFDDSGQPIDILEKPDQPPSHFAVTGLYFYDGQAAEISERLRPSPRGELEITDVNREYLRRGQLHVDTFGRGFTWLDTGTEQSLLQAANYVEAVQTRQGFKIACLEEVAYRMGFIDAEQLRRLAFEFHNPYGDYLIEIVERG